MLHYINDTNRQLSKALLDADWELVKQLDDGMRLQFSQQAQLMSELDQTENQALRTAVISLFSTYEKVVKACQQQKDQLRRELQGVQHNQKAVSAYHSC